MNNMEEYCMELMRMRMGMGMGMERERIRIRRSMRMREVCHIDDSVQEG